MAVNGWDDDIFPSLSRHADIFAMSSQNKSDTPITAIASALASMEKQGVQKNWWALA